MTNRLDIKTQLATVFPQHNYNKTYKPLQIVHTTIKGSIKFYQANKRVPRQTAITDKHYWTQLNEENDSDEQDDVDYLCFTAINDGATLAMLGVKNALLESNFELEYSFDTISWTALEFISETDEDYTVFKSEEFTFDKDDKIYFRGKNEHGTGYYDIDKDEIVYLYQFCGAASSTSINNKFSVSGNLQSIIDYESNTPKEVSFSVGEYALFSASMLDEDTPCILITTAPDIPKVKLKRFSFAFMFCEQVLLENPANMQPFDLHDISGLEDSYCFAGMYLKCTNLKTAANFRFIDFEDIEDYACLMCFHSIYIDTTFNITNNNKDLIGFDDITFPLTDGEDITTEYSFANMLGNTNGFETFNVYISTVDVYEQVTRNIIYKNVIYSLNNDTVAIHKQAEASDLEIKLTFNTTEERSFDFKYSFSDAGPYVDLGSSTSVDNVVSQTVDDSIISQLNTEDTLYIICTPIDLEDNNSSD